MVEVVVGAGVGRRRDDRIDRAGRQVAQLGRVVLGHERRLRARRQQRRELGQAVGQVFGLLHEQFGREPGREPPGGDRPGRVAAPPGELDQDRRQDEFEVRAGRVAAAHVHGVLERVEFEQDMRVEQGHVLVGEPAGRAGAGAPALAGYLGALARPADEPVEFVGPARPRLAPGQADGERVQVGAPRPAAGGERLDEYGAGPAERVEHATGRRAEGAHQPGGGVGVHAGGVRVEAVDVGAGGLLVVGRRRDLEGVGQAVGVSRVAFGADRAADVRQRPAGVFVHGAVRPTSSLGAVRARLRSRGRSSGASPRAGWQWQRG